MKKNDYVISWSEGEKNIEVGKVLDDPTSDGEFDLGLFGGGKISPANECNVVVPEWVADYISEAFNLMPVLES